MGPFSQFHDALIFAIVPPAVQELGNATGFDLQLVDAANIGHDRLVAARNQLLGMASQDKRVAGVRPNSLDDAPALKIEVDQDKARALGLDLAQVNDTIAGAWGGEYINDFIDRGRVKRVYVQGDAPYRSKPEDLSQWFVRGSTGTMARGRAVRSKMSSALSLSKMSATADAPSSGANAIAANAKVCGDSISSPAYKTGPTACRCITAHRR